MSLTGPTGVDGRAGAAGYQLAVEMLNEAGGIDGRAVRLVLRDDESSAAKAAALYREFTSGDSLDAVLGPFSSTVTSAVVPITEAAGWPLVTGFAAAPENVRAGILGGMAIRLSKAFGSTRSSQVGYADGLRTLAGPQSPASRAMALIHPAASSGSFSCSSWGIQAPMFPGIRRVEQGGQSQYLPRLGPRWTKP